MNRMAITLAVTFYACAAYAQSDTQMVGGRELLSWCSDGSPRGEAACLAYIMGISDAVANPNAISCPGNTTRAKRREVVVRYLVQHSENLDLQASLFVTMAL